MPTNLSIPKGVSEIGQDAFEGCTNLKSVTIPASVTNIEFFAFEECENLKEVKYAGTKAQWKKIDEDGDLEFVVHCKDGDVVVE